MSIDPASDCSPLLNTTRRPYVCPPLWVHRPSVPQHWDLASGDKHLDISEEDGYVLSTNGEDSTPGAFVPCEPLSAVRRARPGRLRIKSWILHRRRVSGITTSSPTSHQSPSSGFRIYDRLPPTPATPNTDFKNLFHSLRQRDALAHSAAKAPPHEAPSHPPISPSSSPAVSRTPSSLRQQRPVLYVQTSSPVGTSAPPSTPALPSPCPSAAPFPAFWTSSEALAPPGLARRILPSCRRGLTKVGSTKLFALGSSSQHGRFCVS